MAPWTFAHPERIHLVWATVLVVALLAWLDLRGRDVLGRFLSPAMQLRLSERASLGRRIARLALILITLQLGVIGLMRPQIHRADESVSAQRVRADLMVVLDVSKSMLAEDAAPNRLGRARAEVSELIDKLQGHRVGLVAFAGRAAVLCPLTPDYGFFRMVLRGADQNSVSRGGTRIGDAIRKGTTAFGPGTGARLMLLITDGEDHDSYALEEARKAAESGVRIVAIGFGSETGSEITITDPTTGGKSVLTDRDGAVVISRLDGALLRDIALATEGVYVPAGTAALDLESIIDSHVKPIVHETEVVSRVVTVERYRWPVVASLIVLIAAVWVGSTTGGRRVLA
jgi:Ca-activated chloride channel family protein